eukprot:m.160509 g.160509  ORF g.160509 m.160509 type:complete len:66 (-) comp18027_c1_seq11:348-545(-)
MKAADTIHVDTAGATTGNQPPISPLDTQWSQSISTTALSTITSPPLQAVVETLNMDNAPTQPAHG